MISIVPVPAAVMNPVGSRRVVVADSPRAGLSSVKAPGARVGWVVVHAMEALGRGCGEGLIAQMILIIISITGSMNWPP